MFGSTPRSHKENVAQALCLSSACVDAASEWLQTCQAPEQAVEGIFTIVRDAMGAMAKAEKVIDPVTAERVAEETICSMARRRALCLSRLHAA